jgi:hypothetical protein
MTVPTLVLVWLSGAGCACATGCGGSNAGAPVRVGDASGGSVSTSGLGKSGGAGTGNSGTLPDHSTGSSGAQGISGSAFGTGSGSSGGGSGAKGTTSGSDGSDAGGSGGQGGGGTKSGSSGNGASGGSLASTGASGGVASSGMDASTPATAYAFPLKLAPGKRYPVDQNGTPFLMKADCAWSLIMGLKTADASVYLSDRLSKGFDTVWIGLIDNLYTANASGADAYGNLPFLKALDGTPYINSTTQNPDFSTPNEAYFAHADEVLNLAASDGFLILLSPAWMGYGGGGLSTEGYYKAMVQMSTATLQGYGQYVGKRYASIKNIVWHQGGDYNPPNKSVVENIVTGIKQQDTSHLNDVDTADGTSPMDYWSSEPWLDLDNVYIDLLVDPSEPRVYVKSFMEYQRPNWKPFFYKEGAFEGEHNSAPSFIRQQAYEGFLSGGFGQMFGNNPIWLFASGWQTALNSRGSRDMQQFNALFSNRQWGKLVPDISNTFVTNGAAYSGAQHFAAARASDGSWGVVYVPTGNLNALTVDLSGFSGPVSFYWVDPTSGVKRTSAGSPMQNKGMATVTPPGPNAAADNDWVLVIEP